MVLANHQKIVVGVDGSPSSIATARWAASLAKRLKSPLHIASAIQEPTFYMAESAMAVPAEVWEQQRHTAEELVASLSASIGDTHSALPVTTSVDNVPAADMLIELSRTARLIVVGNSGTGLITSLLLGSTAKKVADKAACPIVVRRGVGENIDAPVMVGVDGSATSQAAVEYAFEFASHFGVPLRAVHAWSSASQAGGVTLPGLVDWTALEREESALLSESLAGWIEKYPDVQVERVLRKGNASHALVELSSECQLVVVGSHGRKSIARVVLGSTSSNLTHHAHCPVMICRDGQSSPS